jgi:hypothetical protein
MVNLKTWKASMNQRVKYQSIEAYLPRGRLVRGSLTDKQTKNHKNEPLPADEYHLWFAIAVPKNWPGLMETWGKIYQHTYQSYMTVPGANPSVIQRIQQGLQAQGFAWKIDDGDADPVWSKREGCPGTLIFQFRTLFELATFDGANRQVDPKIFKLGDYVDAYLSTAINGETGHTAGIHLNPRAVRWLEEGQRIHIGPDANTMFGAPVNAGYQGHQQAAAMPSSVTAPAGNAPAPVSAPTISSPPMNTGTYGQPAAPVAPAGLYEPADQQAARLGIQYFPGYRLDEATRAYVQDVPPAPPAAPPLPNHAPLGAPAPAPVYGSGVAGAAPGSGYVSGQQAYGNPMPAGAPAAPAGAPGFPVPSGVPGGQPATAYPSNPTGHAGYAAPQQGHGQAMAAPNVPGATGYPSSPPAQYSPNNPPPAPPVPGFAGGAPRIG